MMGLTRLERLARALSVVTTRYPWVMDQHPLKLRNPLNGSGGTTKGARYAANARREKERLVGRALATRTVLWDGFPRTTDVVCVVLTRISPNPFDDDNNAAALKSVRDGVADFWGIDDADPRVTWVTDWRKGKADEVELALWVLPDETPRLPVMASDVEVDASDWERPGAVESTKLRKAGL
jgi:hypothetical protein